MNDWISVDERLPDKTSITEVKINNSDNNVVRRLFSGFCGFWTHELNKVENVTHWRPLSDPPKEDIRSSPIWMNPFEEDNGR